MAIRRLAASVLIRASRPSIHHAGHTILVLPSASSRLNPSSQHPHTSHLRFSSTISPLPASKIYTFTDIQTLSSSTTTPKPTLIDTREPSELQNTGTIPGSVNIPITSQPDSFFISEEEFEDRYGFERPGKEEEVVFYCKAGVRSRAAAELAKRAGWERVGEYPGSWLDWERNGGVREGGRKVGK